MKRIFLSAILFCLLSISTSAQGNLQFNAVKYFSLSLTQNTGSIYSESVTAITVPANKVWKIESAGSSNYWAPTNYSSMVSSGRILIDGRVVFDSYSTGGGFYAFPTTLPLWLPAGTYNISLLSSVTGSGTTFRGYVSAIEFNIVP